jgi:hypothetical protein
MLLTGQRGQAHFSRPFGRLASLGYVSLADVRGKNEPVPVWGLARASARSLPAIIDTPMARLDARHREHLVERWHRVPAQRVVRRNLVLLEVETRFDVCNQTIRGYGTTECACYFGRKKWQVKKPKTEDRSSKNQRRSLRDKRKRR